MNIFAHPGITLPPPPGDGGLYFPVAMAPDNQNLPTSHMAIAIHETYEDYCGVSGPPMVASFTVDYKGNTIYNGAMLKTAVYPESMAINPQGNLLAVSAATSDPFTTKYLPGLQVFHFNGGKPITGYSSVLTRTPSVASPGTRVITSTPPAVPLTSCTSSPSRRPLSSRLLGHPSPSVAPAPLWFDRYSQAMARAEMPSPSPSTFRRIAVAEPFPFAWPMPSPDLCRERDLATTGRAEG